MNDTLVYFSKDPIHRPHHHHELTFALLYAFTENFILPMSHDEVAHGKGSLLGKMPGDRWQQFANLRCLLTWMWAHPGRPLLFMGGEIAQNDEWQHDSSVDWHLLDHPEHAGIQALVRALNTVYRASPRCGSRTSTGPGFAGSTRTTRTTACCPSSGSRRRAAAASPASRTSRRCPAMTTASDSRTRGAGWRSSTPTARSSAAATPWSVTSPPTTSAGTTSSTPPPSRCRPSGCCGSLTSPDQPVRRATNRDSGLTALRTTRGRGGSAARRSPVASIVSQAQVAALRPLAAVVRLGRPVEELAASHGGCDPPGRRVQRCQVRRRGIRKPPGCRTTSSQPRLIEQALNTLGTCYLLKASARRVSQWNCPTMSSNGCSRSVWRCTHPAAGHVADRGGADRRAHRSAQRGHR